MRTRSILLCAGLLIVIGASVTSSVARMQGQPKVSPDEAKLAQAIRSAPDAPGKLKAAGEFIKKYPKSALRSNVAGNLADQIADVTDVAQKISLAQQYQTVFNEPAEHEMIVPVLIEGYAGAKRFDEAFSIGSESLSKNADSVPVLVQLLMVGTEQAKQKNDKFVSPSLQYGAHAIELIEADKRPAGMTDAGWKQYKDLLPNLYQSMAVLSLVKGDRVQTKARLAKAAELAPTEAFNYLLLSGVLNDEYQEAAKSYQGMKDGPTKSDELKKVLAALDQVIDAYAHFIALSEGVERYKDLRQQYLQDLGPYYKYRHNNSAEGMQQLIDKYKIAAKP